MKLGVAHAERGEVGLLGEPAGNSVQGPGRCRDGIWQAKTAAAVGQAGGQKGERCPIKDGQAARAKDTMDLDGRFGRVVTVRFSYRLAEVFEQHSKPAGLGVSADQCRNRHSIFGSLPQRQMFAIERCGRVFEHQGPSICQMQALYAGSGPHAYFFSPDLGTDTASCQQLREHAACSLHDVVSGSLACDLTLLVLLRATAWREQATAPRMPGAVRNVERVA